MELYLSDMESIFIDKLCLIWCEDQKKKKKERNHDSKVQEINVLHLNFLTLILRNLICAEQSV